MTLVHIHSSGHYPPYHVHVPAQMLEALKKATKDGYTLSETVEGRELIFTLHVRRDQQKVSGPPSFTEYI